MTTTKGTQDSQFPRATVHKRILDVAEANPDATLKEIASKVSGGTVDLVEQVLDEYGDPGSNEQSAAIDDTTTELGTSVEDNEESLQQPQDENDDTLHKPDGESVADRDKPVERNGHLLQKPGEDKTDDPQHTDEEEQTSQTTDEEIAEVHQKSIDQIEPHLSDDQLETLRLIYEHPTASQREIASMLDVTHTTVYHRLNPIDRFCWDDRWVFVSALFDRSEDENQESIEGSLVQNNGGQIDNRACTTTSVFENPVLTQKIIQACIDAEVIADDELQLIVTDFIPRTVDTD